MNNQNKTRILSGKRIVAVLVSVILLSQLFGIGSVAFGADDTSFTGYGNENVREGSIDTEYANRDGITITAQTDASVATAVITLTLDKPPGDPVSDISQAVDLGGLEASFSVDTEVEMEGTDGDANDTPAVSIDFLDENNSLISSEPIVKADPASAEETLTIPGGASIPANTRTIEVVLTGTNTDGDNTVVFRNPSLKINDAGPPSCDVTLSTEDWTNTPVNVRVEAVDEDAGLEGIYRDDTDDGIKNGTRIATTSPVDITVNDNEAFEVYSIDLAGKESEVRSVDVSKIDKSAPAELSSITLKNADDSAHTTWTNGAVTVEMPALSWDAGAAPEKYRYRIGTGSLADFASGMEYSAEGISEIHIQAVDEAGNFTGFVNATMQIDLQQPVIDIVTQTPSEGLCEVEVAYTEYGLSGIAEAKYAQGSQDASFFESGGTDFHDGESPSTFSVNTGGTYTVYIADNAGNYAMGEYTLNTAPTLSDIVALTIDEDETREIELDITDETAAENLLVTATSSDTDLIPDPVIDQTGGKVTLIFTPALNQFGGPVTISVTVTDEGIEGEDRQIAEDTFEISVNEVNDDPIAADDTATTSEDTVIVVDVLANDTDPADGDFLKLVSVGSPSNGSARIKDTYIEYTPDESFSGTDSFTYTINDFDGGGNRGGSATATLTVTVVEVNDAPVCEDDEAQTDEDVSVLIDVVANDTDVDSGTITLVSVTTPSNGTAVIEDGKVRYTPDENWFGEDTFEYTVEHAGGVNPTGVVTVDVEAVSDIPEFSNINETGTPYTVPEDSTNFPISFNISDPETSADSLMLQAVSLNSDVIENSGIGITGLGDGSDGSVSLEITPVAETSGTAVIRLALGDGFSTVTHEITVNVTEVNDAPVANADEVNAYEDTPYTLPINPLSSGSLIYNDTDIDNAKSELFFDGVKAQPGTGTISENEGDYIYTAPENWFGETTFEYWVSDGTNRSSGTCTIVVKSVNDAPELNGLGTLGTPTQVSADEGVETTGIVSFTVSDIETNDGDLKVYATYDTTVIESLSITNTNGNCTMDVTPAHGSAGETTIRVYVSDKLSRTGPAYINLTIEDIPEDPIATDDHIYVSRYSSSSKTFSVFGNDYDPDGDEISIESHSENTGFEGTLTFDSDTQKFTYTRANSDVDNYTFEYTITDGDTETNDASATVTIHVVEPSSSPNPYISGIPDQYIDEDTQTDALSFTVSDMDTAIENVTVTAASSNTDLVPNNPANIELVRGTEDGDSVGYTIRVAPLPGQSGETTITITANDGDNTGTRTFKVYVRAINDAPVALDDTASVNEHVGIPAGETSVTIDVTANDTDEESGTPAVVYVSNVSAGRVDKTESGELEFIVEGNFHGEATFDYTVVDDMGAEATATVTVTVTEQNDPPLAKNDTAETLEDTLISIDVLRNDSATLYEQSSELAPEDEISETMSVSSISGEIGGSASIEMDGIVAFTPTANFNGTASFEYTLIDGRGGSDTATVTIEVEPVNDAPEQGKYPKGSDPPWTMNEDETKGFDIYVEDEESPDPNLIITINSQDETKIKNTSIRLTTDGDKKVLTMTPEENQSGVVQINITVSDGYETVLEEYFVSILAINDPPEIECPGNETTEETPVSGQITATDVDDVQGDLTFSIISGPSNGTLTAFNPADGSYTYTPDANFFGQDSFEVGVSDPTIAADPEDDLNPVAGEETIAVSGTNDAPTAVDDTYTDTGHPDYASLTTNEDTATLIDVLVNDTDPDIPGEDSLKLVAVTTPANGTAVIVSGEVRYTPDPDYNGEDSFTYTMKDSEGVTDTAIVTVMVNAVNDAPDGGNDSEETREDTPITMNVLTNDDVDLRFEGDTLYIVTDSVGNAALEGGVTPQHGSAVDNGDGTITYTPALNYNGMDSFTYKVRDEAGLTDMVTVTMTVTPVNDAPVLTYSGGNVSYAEDGSATVTFSFADVEDGTSLTPTASHDNSYLLPDLTPTETGTPGEWEVVLDSNDFTNGSAEITLSVTDNGSPEVVPAQSPVDIAPFSDTQTFTLTVTEFNNAPSAQNDTAEADENGSAVDIYVLDNDDVDTQHEGDTLTILQIAGQTGTYTVEADGQTLGTLEMVDEAQTSATNKLVFTPNPNWTSDTPVEATVNYTMKDSYAPERTSSANVTITLNPDNDAPTITEIDDQGIAPTIGEDTPGTDVISFTIGDEEDASADLVVTATCLDNPELFPDDLITLGGTGDSRTIQVQPAAHKYGTGTITVTVTDTGDGDGVSPRSATETFTVTITRTDDPPVSPEEGADEYTISEDLTDEIGASHTDLVVVGDTTHIKLDVLVNDDVDYLSDRTGFEILSYTAPAHGSLIYDPDNVEHQWLLYSPGEDETDQVTFSYTMRDNNGAQQTYQVTVNITPVNDPPVLTLVDDADYDENDLYEYSTNEGTQIKVPFTVSDIDDDDDLETGVMTITRESFSDRLFDDDFTYAYDADLGEWCFYLTPNGRWNGTGTLEVYAQDDDGAQSETRQFKIRVIEINDAPTAVDDTFEIDEDDVTFLNVIENDEDPDLETNEDKEKLTVIELANVTPGINVSIATKTIEIDGEDVEVSGFNVMPSTENYNGGSFSFTYKVEDSGLVGSEGVLQSANTALVELTILPVNDPPVADDETAETEEDVAVTIDVLDGDTDIDNDSGLNEHPDATPQTLTIYDWQQPSHGTVAEVGGQLVYTPSSNYNGTDSFDYRVHDGTALDTGTVDVTITPVNDNPAPEADSVTTPEDTSILIDALANDIDADNDSGLNEHPDATPQTLTITSASVNAEAHGEVTIEAGKLRYTPDPNWYGSDVITYTVEDGEGGSTQQTVDVEVTPVNDPPVFETQPEDMTIYEDESEIKHFSVSDLETPWQDLTVSLHSSSNTALIDTENVVITMRDGGGNGDRTVMVAPKENQSGSATLTLVVSDGSATATCAFDVTVNAENDAPVALDDSDTIPEEGTSTLSWTGLVSDVENDTLTVTIETNGSNGNASVVGNNLVYAPDEHFNGIDTYEYRVSDGNGGYDIGEIMITVTPVNDPPTAANDTPPAGNEDTNIVIDVLANDTDPDTGDDTPDVLSILTSGALVPPAHGTLSVSDGKLVYTPSANYNGSDTFEYFAYDGDETSKASVTVYVNQVNDPPTAADYSTSTDDEVPVTADVLVNCTDIDTGLMLNQDAAHSEGTFSVQSYYFVGDANGTLSESGGSITYTPAVGYSGTQVIEYVLADGHSGTDTGRLTVLVNVQDDPPTAVDDTMVTPEDVPVTVNVLTNDFDVDPGDSLTFVDFVGDTSSLPGTLDSNADGTVTFTPNSSFRGSFTVDYTVQDSKGLTDTGTIFITVTEVNDPPVATDDAKTTAEDTPKKIDTTGLVSDTDIATVGDVVTVSVEGNGGAQHGTVSVNGDEITYTPDKDYNGTDSFTYTASDRFGGSDTGLIFITVTPVNDKPVPADDTAKTNEDQAVSIDVLANDTDVDTDKELNAVPQGPLALVSASAPANGSTEIVSGEIVYTPNENYNGKDSFTYTASDGIVTMTATVTVTVSPVNDKPVAADDTASTTDGDMVAVYVLANDTDADTGSSEGLTVASAGSASNGVVAVNGVYISYTPSNLFSGTDTFTYTIRDANGAEDTATVTVTVTPANDPPEMIAVFTPADGERYGGNSTINVTWDAFDIDGDDLTYTLEYYDGSDWIVVGRGLASPEYAFSVPASLGSITDLQFRANANDGEFTSEYAYSGRVTVDTDVPTNIVVTYTKEDGTPYDLATWTNQDVTVRAESVSDASSVTFAYDVSGDGFAQSDDITVSTGTYDVYIRATDEFDQSSDFGGYILLIDKLRPAVPNSSVELSGDTATITLTLLSDPGESGNDVLTNPDGSRVDIEGTRITFAAEENGAYEFVLTDVAGNETTFTVMVDVLPEYDPPMIDIDTGEYVIGEVSQTAVDAQLIFTSETSPITARGFELSASATPSGVYQKYDGEITIGQGQYYIHAFARNEAGLTAYETFGPFIVQGEQALPQEETLPPVIEEVVIEPEVFGEGTTMIRLPGGEWAETLVLENMQPGTILIEVMDEDGNITVMEYTIEEEGVAAARMDDPLMVEGQSWYVWLIIGIGLLLLLIILLLWRNVYVSAYQTSEEGEDKKMRTVRKLFRKKDELTVEVDDNHVKDSDFGWVTLGKGLTRRMRGKTLVVKCKDVEVLRVDIPTDADGRFEDKIPSWNK